MSAIITKDIYLKEFNYFILPIKKTLYSKPLRGSRLSPTLK